jgi:cytoskeletal protein CcmA (bactofilin family)
MWKKGEMPDYERQQQPTPKQPPASYAESSPPAPRSAGQAVIGRSITIRGEVTGDEDLVIQGRVDGSVDLIQHSVTVGPEGQVKANINGRVVTVEGRVEGNVTGEEQVVLRKSSWVQGDIRAPRVVLEDGAHFRGGVTMGEDVTSTRRPAPAAQKPEAEKTAPSQASNGTPAQPNPAAPTPPRGPTPRPAEVKG